MELINKRKIFKGDKIIWAVFFIICSISLVEVFSATSQQAETSNYWKPIIKHTIFLLTGTVLVWIIHNMKVSWIRSLTYIFYWAGVIGLIWAQFSSEINNSARWISIFGMTFQPMEIAKVGLVMVTAQIISKHQNEEGTDDKALMEIAKYAALPIIIILKENLSTALITCLTIFMMMFIGRLPKKQLLLISGGTIASGIVAVLLLLSVPSSLAKEGDVWLKVVTWKNRIIRAMDSKPIDPKTYIIDDYNRQSSYAKIAIASSDIIGCGPGNSEYRAYIPHAYSDFIFAVIIEELGLAGGVVVILLYLTILYRCGKIAGKCEDPYPAYLAMGVGMIITIQALLHMYISVGDFVTGQPLPIMSQGGTSILINCIYIGIILSISRYTIKANAVALQQNRNTDTTETVD